MNNEFKKLTYNDQTVYVLEDASSGGTSAGSIATVSKPVDSVRKRGQNLIAQEGNKDKVDASKPRNFVAKNAKMGGAGAHKDQKKAAKQGDVKHKNKEMDMAEGERRMSRAAKGYEKYGKKGMIALAKAGREGASDDKLDKIRDKHDHYNEGVAEGAPELLKKEMPLHRHAEKLVAQNGVSKDDPDYYHHLNNTIKHLRRFGNIDLINKSDKQDVAEGSEDKIKQLKADHATAVHWSKNETSPQKREAARRKAETIKAHLEKQYKQGVAEEWSQKYKSSINCSHPKGFSQKAHCAGKKKHTESMMTMEATCPDCGMCQTHGDLNEIKKGAKDSNGFTKCWPGHHAAGTKKGKNGGQVRNCVPNEGVAEEGYGNHPSQRVDPRTGKKYVPPKSPLGQGVAEDHSTATGGWGQGAYASASTSSKWNGAGRDDSVHENPDWYNDEANGMTTSQLKSLIKHAAKLRHAVKAMQAQGDTLEPWQQAKVTKAADYLDAVFTAVDDDYDMGENVQPHEEDQYMAELQAKLNEKIPKNAPVERWIDDFAKAAKTPNAKGHHQFKNKNPEKIRQMAIAASYSAKNPSKKKK
jgi:hypothetical protein